MPMPRTPTVILERTGAFKGKPSRRRTDPDTPGPLGEPPQHLTDAERESWLLIVEEAPLDVLTRADRAVVELAARLRAYIKDADMGDVQAAKLTLFNKCLTQLGMTPADRSRVAPSEKPRKSKWRDG